MPNKALWRSPLWMVMRAPLVNELVASLAQAVDQLRDNPSAGMVLCFDRAELEQVREAFAAGIRKGESKLHLLCALLTTELLDCRVDRQTVVIGQAPGSGERFTLMQPVSERELAQTTDLDLGRRRLARVLLDDGGEWGRPELVANFVEYQPHRTNPLGIQKIISRIKAEEEIWNKVLDELFHLDDLVKRDKELAALSYFVKDILGVKIVVSPFEAVLTLQEQLESLRFDDDVLSAAGIRPSPATRRLTVVEKKNYLGSKQSGWEALKSVVTWGDQTFEIQVQPLGNYHREREYLSRESHSAFKQRRDHIREHLAEQDPLYAFFRDLLRFLFVDAKAAPPSHPGVTVQLTDSRGQRDQ